jgi:hypothetical protein
MDLILSFKDQSESFVLGCEYGRILAQLEMGLENVSNNFFPIHIKNLDVIKDACLFYGYSFITGETYYETYIQFQAIKQNRLN